MESKNISKTGAEIEKLLKKGYEEIEAKRWDYAIIVFEKILSMSKGNRDALDGILEAHKAHANDAIASGNWGEASAAADTILGIAKENAFPYIIKILAGSQKNGLDSEIYLDLFFAEKFINRAPEDKRKRKNKEKDKIKYQELIKLYESVLLYADKGFANDIQEKAKEAIYSTVCENFNNLEIEKAEELLHYIENYKDIEEKTKEAKYNRACKLATDGQCASAKEAFEALFGYKDSGNRAYLCESYIELEASASNHLKSYAKEISELKSKSDKARSRMEFTIFPVVQFSLMVLTVLLVVFGFVNGYYFDLPSVFSIIYLIISIAVYIGLVCTIYHKRSRFSSIFPDYNWGRDPEGDIQYLAGIVTMGIIFSLATPVTSVMDLFGFFKDLLTAKKEFKKVSEEIEKFCDKLKYLLETMLGDEVETFEADAKGVGFMVGYGKALIEKYSKI
jgi:hypothetical protein